MLAWYKSEGRHDFPWRETKDPYAILVSEFMLQQTTVATVRPYYERFLSRFPTLSSLATAELNEVLALWSGLGYYARARNLWAAAKTIHEGYKGKIPADAEILFKLPGIGTYTAGAIAALAFNKPAIALDANITRVLMRLLALDEDPKLKAVQVILRKASLELTRLSLKNPKRLSKHLKGGPRDVVLALMDLGATLCAPNNPQCLICPASSLCLAKKHGRQDDIPAPKEKMERPIVRQVHALLRHKGKWLMGQRPKEGLFGGLWEFVAAESLPGINPVLFLEEAIFTEMGLQVRVKEAMPAFEHQLSHKVLVIRPFFCEIKPREKRIHLPKKGPHYESFRWVPPTSFNKLGVSSITKRIITQLPTQ